MTTALLTSDLLFHSRIVSHGHAAGIPVQVVGTLESLLDLALKEPFQLIMVDLTTKGVDLDQLAPTIATLKAQHPQTHVVAYGPHVDEQSLHKAQQADCDEVLTKGQFDRAIRQILDRYAKNCDLSARAEPEERP